MNEALLLRYFQIEHYAAQRDARRHLALVEPADGDAPTWDPDDQTPEAA